MFDSLSALINPSPVCWASVIDWSSAFAPGLSTSRKVLSKVLYTLLRPKCFTNCKSTKGLPCTCSPNTFFVTDVLVSSSPNPPIHRWAALVSINAFLEFVAFNINVLLIIPYNEPGPPG